MLAALSAQSIFFLGPPGVAKSMVGRRIAAAFRDARFFEYLMGRFSTPDELFGPVSISRLRKDDSYTRNTEGFLPTADIVFLDEIWKASPPIQNSLLSILNERIFRNGDELLSVPLKCFIGASNALTPHDDTRAFWDRFLIRVHMRPIESAEQFQALLISDEKDIRVSHPIAHDEWSNWREKSSAIGLNRTLLEIIVDIRDALKELDHEQYYVSDRRWKQIAELLRCSAFFHSRREADIADSFIIPYCIWNDPDHDVRTIFHEKLRMRVFSKYIDLGDLELDIAAFTKDLTRATHIDEDVSLLEPRKYDGEYLRFLPKPDPAVAPAADPAAASDGQPELDTTEYRVWAEDLENLDARSELEVFMYRNGTFVEMTLCAMNWSNREKWELTGSLGTGRIECGETVARKSVPVRLKEKERKHYEETFRSLLRRIEQHIVNFDSHVQELYTAIRTHLFVPQENNSVLEQAAKHTRGILEEKLAVLLLEGKKQGLKARTESGA